MNLTVAFMEMIYTTKSAWTEDYLRDNQSVEGGQSVTRKRAPFVPFLLRNKTGCALSFGTLTTSPAKAVGSVDNQEIGRRKSQVQSVQSWREVEADDEVPVTFESRDKMRHKVGKSIIHLLVFVLYLLPYTIHNHRLRFYYFGNLRTWKLGFLFNFIALIYLHHFDMH